MFSYHRHDPMLVSEINAIVGFVANSLYLVLCYHGESLYSRALIGLPLLKKKKVIVIFRSLLILLDGTYTPGQLIIPVLTLAINSSFLLLLKPNQSNKQSFIKGKNVTQLWDGFI